MVLPTPSTSAPPLPSSYLGALRAVVTTAKVGPLLYAPILPPGQSALAMFMKEAAPQPTSCP